MNDPEQQAPTSRSGMDTALSSWDEAKLTIEILLIMKHAWAHSDQLNPDVPT